MPSSPIFTDYARIPERFFFRGMQILPQDALTEGKAAYALNMRSYQEGTVTVREGLIDLTSSALPDPIHSIFRLNDTTPYVSGLGSEVRIVGAGTSLYGGLVPTSGTEAYSTIGDPDYSGDPLTAVIATPFASPRPYLYVADSQNARKVNVDFDDYPHGVYHPRLEPSAIYQPIQTTYLNSIVSGLWSSYGSALPASPTPLVILQYINTVVTAVVYDEGAAPGMACIALDYMFGVVPGTSIEVGASAEEVIVEEVHPAISPTTIGSILYDVGTSGLCTIQPEGSFTQGQIEAAVPADIQARYDAEGLSPPRVTVTRTVDYPVDSLIVIGGLETVRILAVALGPDGTMSFRCSTSGTYVATDTITGVPCFRAYCNTTVSVADPAIASSVINSIQAQAAVKTVGGMQSPMSGAIRNWGFVGNRASQPPDYIRFAIKITSYALVESVRLMLNVSDDDGFGASDFLHNYYFYEWRQNDLLAAIQTSVGASTGLVADSQASAVQQGQVDSHYQNQYGQPPPVRYGPRGIIPGSGSPTYPKGPKGTAPKPKVAERPTPLRETDNLVTVGSAISRQLSVGNDQWVVLQCRIADLTRVGADQTLTLNGINGAAITVQLSEDPDLGEVFVEYADAYLTGGYGADVSTTWNPYVYRFRYRSTITGARSNPSPPMRAGVKPHRARITLSGDNSTDPQVDVMDWYRLGGALARWAYVGTSDNGEDFVDDFSDSQIESGETVEFNHYQPWPVADLPRSGTCNVSGTAVDWVSGDTFNTQWAEGSLVLIDGRATALYRSPDSTTRFYVKDSCGQGQGVPFSLPSPTIVSLPMRAIWGGPINDVFFLFGCGDFTDAGVLHWTNGNDPDSTSDINTLVVTDASEPLINGFFYDGIPYVFSSNRLFRIEATFGDISTFRVSETACTRGLWTPWSFCVTPYGTVFLSGDGLYFTAGGTEAQPLTDPDLRPVFPQDGSTPQTTRNVVPVDYAAVTQIKLTYVDQLVYFDYQNIDGGHSTLVYDQRVQGWVQDRYDLSPPTARLQEEGEHVHSAIIGASNGMLYAMDANQLTDVLTDIPWAYWTSWENAQDPRAFKQWGDAILDMNSGSSILGVTVTPVVDNGNTALAPRTLGAGGTLRTTYIVEVGQTEDTLGDGVWSRNFGMWIEGTIQACDIQRPILYLWEPSFSAKQVSVARRATDWQDLGYNGAKFVQGVVIRANTFGLPKTINVQYDGPNTGPQTGVALTLDHDGEQTIAYPLSAAGWDPFVAELVRLQGADDVEWALLDWRFVWEPAPEAATQWQTQFTTHDCPGFLAIYDGVIAYESSTVVTWTIEYQDGFIDSYLLPDTAGAYLRTRVVTAARKGKAVRYTWTADEPFRLYKSDCSVRMQPWGFPGGYHVVTPFGGPHRADGAGI